MNEIKKLMAIFAMLAMVASTGQAYAAMITADGSSTVYPISEAVAEEFGKENPDVQVTVGVSGTGGGFKRFCRGETDISNASRPIKSKEADQCFEEGVEYIEIPVAYDGLAVMINPQNDWASTLTVKELNKIWAPESQAKVTKWNQIRSTFPDAPLKLVGPGTDSGTFDYFTEVINGKSGSSRGDYVASEDDNVLVQAIATDKNALGYFGLAYYEENKDKLKLVGVDDENAGNGAGPVQPSMETVLDGTYQPLARPIFIYVSKKAAERPEIKAFITYYLKHSTELVKEVGYIPLSQQAYDLALARFEAGKTGSLFKKGTSGIKLEDALAK
jgi:phosphate transport system substrate-binding protein